MEDERKFGGFLSDICGDILFKKVRAEVEDELYDHLMCQYEKNLACGMTEEEAEKQAKKDLGSTNELKQKLSAVHSYFPSLSAKKALDMMTVGFIIYYLCFEIYFLRIVGLLFIVCSAFCLRTANKTLKVGFGFSVLYFISYVSAVSFENWFYLNQPLLTCVKIFLSISWCLVIIFVLIGILKLVKPYKNEFSPSVSILPTLFVAILYEWCLLCFYAFDIEVISAITSFKESNFISVNFGLALLFFRSLMRSSKILYNNDIEYNIESSPIKKVLVIACAFVVACSCLTVGSFNFNKEATQGTQTVIDDIQMSDKEYGRICNNLLSYGVPKNVIKNLPKSEIAQFKGSMNYSEMTPSAKKKLDEYSKIFSAKPPDSFTKHEKNGFNYDFSVWLIGIPEEKGDEYKCFRAIYLFKYPEEIKHKYNDIIFFDYYDGYHNDISVMGPVGKKTEFVKLFDDNGKEYKPFSTFKDTDLSPALDQGLLGGIEFQARENLNIYYAVNYSDIIKANQTSIKDDNKDYTCEKTTQTYSLYHKEFPISIYRTPRLIFEKYEPRGLTDYEESVPGYTDYIYCPVQWFVVHPDLIYS